MERKRVGERGRSSSKQLAAAAAATTEPGAYRCGSFRGPRPIVHSSIHPTPIRPSNPVPLLRVRQTLSYRRPSRVTSPHPYIGTQRVGIAMQQGHATLKTADPPPLARQRSTRRRRSNNPTSAHHTDGDDSASLQSSPFPSLSRPRLRPLPRPLPRHSPATSVPSAYLVQSLIAGALDAQVDHGVLQRPAHVVLQRQVVDALKTETAPASVDRRT